MNKNTKPQKGEFGYLKYRKTRSLLHLIILVLTAVGIFVLGLALNKWEATNIFTILAIVMVLPAARVFVSLVILIPYKQSDEEIKNMAEKYKREDDDLLLDVVFTSSEHVMHLDALLVSGHQAVGLYTATKGKPEKIEEYFKKEFAARKLDFIYYQAPSAAAFESRLKRRGDSEILSEKQAQDRKEFMEMIKTAIV